MSWPVPSPGKQAPGTQAPVARTGSGGMPVAMGVPGGGMAGVVPGYDQLVGGQPQGAFVVAQPQQVLAQVVPQPGMQRIVMPQPQFHPMPMQQMMFVAQQQNQNRLHQQLLQQQQQQQHATPPTPQLSEKPPKPPQDSLTAQLQEELLVHLAKKAPPAAPDGSRAAPAPPPPPPADRFGDGVWGGAAGGTATSSGSKAPSGSSPWDTPAASAAWGGGGSAAAALAQPSPPPPQPLTPPGEKRQQQQQQQGTPQRAAMPSMPLLGDPALGGGKPQQQQQPSSPAPTTATAAAAPPEKKLFRARGSASGAIGSLLAPAGDSGGKRGGGGGGGGGASPAVAIVAKPSPGGGGGGGGAPQARDAGGAKGASGGGKSGAVGGKKGEHTPQQQQVTPGCDRFGGLHPSARAAQPASSSSAAAGGGGGGPPAAAQRGSKGAATPPNANAPLQQRESFFSNRMGGGAGGDTTPTKPTPGSSSSSSTTPATSSPSGNSGNTPSGGGGWRATGGAAPGPPASGSAPGSPATPSAAVGGSGGGDGATDGGDGGGAKVFKARGGGWRNPKALAESDQRHSGGGGPRGGSSFPGRGEGWGTMQGGGAADSDSGPAPPITFMKGAAPVLFLADEEEFPCGPIEKPQGEEEGEGGATSDPAGSPATYQRRLGETKTSIHWGQRKLLLSEIQFMLRAREFDRPVTVVYAGSAPGIHLHWVAKQFEGSVKEWVLIDPAEFDLRCHEFATVFNTFFTDSTAWRIRRRNAKHKGIAILTEVAAGVMHTDDVEMTERAVTGQVTNLGDADLLRNKDATRESTPSLDKIFEIESDENPIFFISDIRTGNIAEGGGPEFEEEVRRNMADQMQWRDIIRPDYAMLKFRLPYMTVEHKGEVYHHPHRTTEYLDGQIQLQIWAPQTSTETRLIVPKSAVSRPFDNKRYEDLLYHHNTVVRQQHHYNHCLQGNLLDHRWDARAEVEIIQQMLAPLRGAEEEAEGGGSGSGSASSEEISRVVGEISHCLHKSFDKQLSAQYKKFLARAERDGFLDDAREIVRKCKKERARDVWWKNSSKGR